MAKKKVIKRKRTKVSGIRRSKRRRSKVGATGGIDFTSVLLTVGGAVASSYLDKVIPDTIDKKIVAGAKMVIGVVLPMVSKDPKTKLMLNALGQGILASGTIDMLQATGILSGSEDPTGDDLFISMNGNTSVLAGDESLMVVNGDDNTVSLLAGADDLNVVNGEEDLSIINGYGDSDEDDDDM